jgi:hypothetical protein
MRKNITSLILLLAFSYSQQSHAQLVINGGTITIESGATVSVQGNLTSNADILGAGKVVMNGTTSQQINTNGFIIPNLEISNATNVVLAGNTKVSGSLLFTAGKIQTGNYNLALDAATTFSGVGAGKFVETNGTGLLKRDITVAGTYNLPVGSGNDYMPVQYQVTGGTIAAGASVGTQLIAGAHPNKPVRATDYITSYWKPVYTGITGSTINVTGTYVDAASIAGDETLLNGLRYDGTDWSLANNTINTTSNTVTYSSVASGSDLYAMDKFLLMNSKVFLQGPFNGTTMNDNLRAAGLIPTSDPYRTAPYSSFFTHTNNSEVEIASAAVFNDKATDDNIVDWIFLELRNSTGTLIQTRSALLQKDGDVVDIDGVNPVFFKNLDAGNFVVTVRHRNHLGLSADLTNYVKALSIAKPIAANKFDFTGASDAQIFGDAQAFYTSGAVKMLWGGNANSNGSSRYAGPSNDHSYLLSTELAGNGSAVISGVYKSGDLNMNGNVRYSGPSNDHSFLLNNVLSANGSAVISQQILP